MLKNDATNNIVVMQLDKQLCFKRSPGIFDTNRFDVVGDPRKMLSLKGIARRGDELICGDGDAVEFAVEDGLEGKAHLKTKFGQYVVSYKQKLCLKPDGNKLAVA